MLWSFGMVGLPYSNSNVPGSWKVLYNMGHAILLIISKNTDPSMHLMNNVSKISVSLWVCLSIWHLTVSQNTLISLCHRGSWFPGATWTTGLLWLVQYMHGNLLKAHLVKLWYVNNVSYTVFMTSANLNQLQLMIIDPTGRVVSYQRTAYIERKG